MMIVDAQVHTWTTGSPASVHQQEPFTNDQLIRAMDEAGVDRAVLVPPGWDPDGLSHAEAGVRAHPQRFAIMGRIALEAGERRDVLRNWKRPGVLGLRLTFGTGQSLAALTDGGADWVWDEAERCDIPIMFAIWGHLALAIPIVQRHPGLRFVIDHLGVPVTYRTMDDAAFSDMDAVLALARFPNVAVKASGVPGYSTEPYPYRNVHGHVRRVFDAFGPDRTFWGTDLTRMPCTYRECITLFTEELPWLSDTDKQKVMGTALCRWIGWTI